MSKNFTVGQKLGHTQLLIIVSHRYPAHKQNITNWLKNVLIYLPIKIFKVKLFKSF